MSFCASQPAAPKAGGDLFQFTHPQNLCMRLVNFENYFALSELEVFIYRFYSKGYSSYTVSGGELSVVPKIAVRSRVHCG